MKPAELEQLYDAHAAGVFHYLVSFAQTEADAKDLLQEVFIKLAQVECRAVMGNEKAFIFRTAHNQAIDWMRRRHTRRNSEERLFRELEEGHQTTPDPDMAVLAQYFTQALGTLPVEQRSVLQLKLYDGLTFDEIAEAQGIPLNTAASRYRYALEKLRALLKPLYEELT